jgi:hypothetical protein
MFQIHVAVLHTGEVLMSEFLLLLRNPTRLRFINYDLFVADDNIQNVATECLSLLRRIQKVPVSTLGPNSRIEDFRDFPQSLHASTSVAP